MDAEKSLTKDGKDKDTICKMLGTCLEEAHEIKTVKNGKVKDIQDETEGCKSTELVPSLKIEQLKKQHKEAQLNKPRS